VGRAHARRKNAYVASDRVHNINNDPTVSSSHFYRTVLESNKAGIAWIEWNGMHSYDIYIFQDNSLVQSKSDATSIIIKGIYLYVGMELS
jgi:hypothetical protein